MSCFVCEPTESLPSRGDDTHAAGTRPQVHARARVRSNVSMGCWLVPSKSACAWTQANVNVRPPPPCATNKPKTTRNLPGRVLVHLPQVRNFESLNSTLHLIVLYIPAKPTSHRVCLLSCVRQYKTIMEHRTFFPWLPLDLLPSFMSSCTVSRGLSSSLRVSLMRMTTCRMQSATLDSSRCFISRDDVSNNEEGCRGPIWKESLLIDFDYCWWHLQVDWWSPL